MVLSDGIPPIPKFQWMSNVSVSIKITISGDNWITPFLEKQKIPCYAVTSSHGIPGHPSHHGNPRMVQMLIMAHMICL